MEYRTGQAPPSSGVATQSALFRTRIDCLRHLVAVARTASLSTVAGALLLVFWLHDFVEPLVVGIWLAGMLTLAALRLRFVHNFTRHFNENRKQQVARWERAYTLLIAASGLLWGLAGRLDADGGPRA